MSVLSLCVCVFICLVVFWAVVRFMCVFSLVSPSCVCLFGRAGGRKGVVVDSRTHAKEYRQ